MLHISQLPADSRTVRALAGAVPGMNLDQQLLMIISHKLDMWDWKYQMMHSNPESKDREERETAKLIREAQPKSPEIHRAPGWIDEDGALRTIEEMEQLREEMESEARERETSDNQVESKSEATGQASDFASLMSGH